MVPEFGDGKDEKAYVRPMVKIPVRTNFCAWLVLRRQRIGIGYTHCPLVSLLFLGVASMASPTYQSKKYKVCSRIDRPGYEEVEFHINTSLTRCGTECASQRVPEIVHGYTLED